MTTRIISHHEIPGASTDKVRVASHDEAGPGGAHHEYSVTWDDSENALNADGGARLIGNRINFQKGPIKEAGPNGLTNEALLAVVIDRLECFQRGPYACASNEEALGHIKIALDYLLARTRDRLRRGVEGQSKL